MRYFRNICLKDGRECIIRNADGKDAADVLRTMMITHGETDYLLSYPEELSFTSEEEEKYLQKKADSSNEIELCAIVDGKLAGIAGLDAVGSSYKLSHRAEYGVCIERAFWGLGIGSALTESCIELARNAGYKQLELTVVSENKSAVALYEKFGFIEFGRNPLGFKSKLSGFQEIIQMRLEL